MLLIPKGFLPEKERKKAEGKLANPGPARNGH